MANYDRFASFYDSVVGERQDVARFLRKLLTRYAPHTKTVLELGCGSGSMMALLSKHYQVTGLDQSARMIALAHSKAPRARALVGDITEFRLKSSFDAVLCPFDTINHITSFAAWKRVFRNAHAHLADDGVFIFDVNTEAKMERYRTEPAAADLKRDKIAIVDVERTQRYRYLVILKLLQRVRGENFRHHELRIPELIVPTDRILRELRRLFTKVSLVDPERERPTAKTEELFFVCQKPKR